MNAAISRRVRRAAMLATVVTVFSSTAASAQSLLDAIRLSEQELPLPGRAMSMDGAGIAGANNYSALGENPAALAPIASRELEFSLMNFSHQSTADFLGTSSDGSSASTSFSSIGGVFPAPTTRGHFAFALGYDLVRDYTRAYTFSAIDTASSFLNTAGFVQDPQLNMSGQNYRDELDQEQNLAWVLHLTRDVADSPGVPLKTLPFSGGLRQIGDVTEEGGLHALRIGGGIDIAEGVSVGATLSGYFGSYDYYRKYTERDDNKIYAGNVNELPPLNFVAAQITDSRHQDQGGIGLKLGLLAWQLDAVRFGLTVETPTVLHIDDEFVRTGTAQFTKGTEYSLGPDQAISTVNSYNVVTPLRFSGGLAFKLAGATIEADGSYSDMSQLRYTDADVDLSDLNDEARQMLRGVFSWRLGGEYIIAPLGMSVRAGYGFEPSAYKSDPATYGKTTFSGGVGALLSKSVMLEATLLHTSYTTDHVVYNDVITPGDLQAGQSSVPVSAIVTNDAVKQWAIGITLSFRY